jgi:hypothetical protein
MGFLNQQYSSDFFIFQKPSNYVCKENDVCKFSNFLSRSTLKILLPSYDNCTLKLKTKFHILGLIHLPFPIPLTSFYVKVKKQNECIHTLLVLIQIMGEKL